MVAMIEKLIPLFSYENINIENFTNMLRSKYLNIRVNSLNFFLF